MNAILRVEELFETTSSHGASDLHLVAGRHPTLRIDGALMPLVKESILSTKETEEFAFALTSPAQKEQFLQDGEIDFAYNFKNKARFRINVCKERGFIAVACRFIPNEIRTLSDLKLPDILSRFTHYSQGLVIVVGPTGQGKSSTLAALIDLINHSRGAHILTIEDPIEYLFQPDRAIITQREVRTDTVSFSTALMHAFRQDPDVLMVGEMRDPETIGTTITAAETGHLVFTTLHTNSASQTIDRIIDSFPGYQQNQVRSQLANILLGIVSQRLLPRLDGGRVPACEILMANNAIRNMIRENKTHQIDMVIGTSVEEGMISLDRYLADLVKRREISLETAQMHSLNANELKELIK